MAAWSVLSQITPAVMTVAVRLPGALRGDSRRASLSVNTANDQEAYFNCLSGAPSLMSTSHNNTSRVGGCHGSHVGTVYRLVGTHQPA
jgi:hypothetical protein